jgi:hypothetical protein
MQMARGFLQHFCTRVLQPALLIGACPLSQLRRPMGRKRRRRHRIAMFASTCDIWSSMSEQFSVAILCHPFADAIIWTVCIKASGIDRILTVRPDMHVFGISNIFVTSVACGSVSYCVENATLASHSQPCVTTYESRLPLSLVVAIKTDEKWRCAQLACCWPGQQGRRAVFCRNCCCCTLVRGRPSSYPLRCSLHQTLLNRPRRLRLLN